MRWDESSESFVARNAFSTLYLYLSIRYLCVFVSATAVRLCVCVFLGNSLRDNLKVFAWLWVIQLLELGVWMCIFECVE